VDSLQPPFALPRAENAGTSAQGIAERGITAPMGKSERRHELRWPHTLQAGQIAKIAAAGL